MIHEPIHGQALMVAKGKFEARCVMSPTNMHIRVELCPGDYVTISASRYPFAHVMPPGRRSEDWINSISRTLQWNSRQRQKPFKEWDDENKQPAK